MGKLADRDSSSGRLRRRAFPIAAYVGPNGSGKSAVMVYDTIPSLDAGRPVLSTVRLLDFRAPRDCSGGVACDDPSSHHIKRTRWVLTEFSDGSVKPVPTTYETGEIHKAAHPYYVRFHSYQQLVAWRDGDVLMDEVTGVASSREVTSMPVQVANYLVQLRRRNVVLRWSSPNWGRADKIIREVTQAVNFMVGSIPKRRPTPEGEAPRLWRDNRLFHARTFDPSAMEEFEAHRADLIDHLFQRLYWRPGAMLESAYDTLDPVTALGWANDAGMCMTCGGKRTTARCDCPDHAGASKNVRGRGDSGRGGVPESAAKQAEGTGDRPGTPGPGPRHPDDGGGVLTAPLPVHPLIASTVDAGELGAVLPTLLPVRGEHPEGRQPWRGPLPSRRESRGRR